MLDYYAEQKLNPIFETFVKKTALKDQMALKMDTALFHEYVKKQQQAEAVNDKEMRTDERLFSLEQGVKRAITREEAKAKLELKASVQKMSELQDGVQRLLAQTTAGKEKQEKENRRLDADMAERAALVDGLIQDLEGRLKAVEDELNDEDPAEGADRVESGLEQTVVGGFGNTGENLPEVATDDGHVNIGDTKTIVAAVASEATLPPKEPVVSAGPEDGAAQSVHAPGKAQGSPTVQSSTNLASKATLKGQVVRKSGGRKKTDGSGASGA